MRILITNNTLGARAGSELYVRDVAVALLKRGHSPIAYSTVLGEVAWEMRVATIPVIDNLDALSSPPDVIHGQHHLETMTALLRFPGVPAVYFCHGWLPWEEAPPRFPRILRYVAIDQLCRERLLFEHGIPDERIKLLLNFVDLERFKRRSPLPTRPQRALFFSNYHDVSRVAVVREACARHQIELDVVGVAAGNDSAHPERLLGKYDLIFARGRSALEALAVGAAVVVCGIQRAGPMVTTAALDELRLLNFGLRTFREPLTAGAIADQIARYDPADAAEVTSRIRATAGMQDVIDSIIEVYEDVVEQNKNADRKWSEESEAASAYLRWLSPTYKEALRSSAESTRAVGEALSNLAAKEHHLQTVTSSVGWRLINKYGPIKHRFLLPAYRGLTGIFNGGKKT